MEGQPAVIEKIGEVGAGGDKECRAEEGGVMAGEGDENRGSSEIRPQSVELEHA